jgi:hypothetical protein
LYSVQLPASKIVLPRQQPPPKEKQLTKWEKFRQERGITPREKRSRMVYDEITKDWVPRFGMGSIKKIQKNNEYIMVEKPKHVEAGMDPFTYKQNEKRLDKEKQNLREVKNKVLQDGVSSRDKGKDQVLGANSKEGQGQGQEPSEPVADKPTEPKRPFMKQRGEVERENIRKRERKSLMKSLKMAQMSTASMGKFDKKASKTEVNLNKNINMKTKAVKKNLSQLEKGLGKSGQEKERNLKILGLMQKERDSKR